jgi:thiol-disulfide isomerase/thioredoxin
MKRLAGLTIALLLTTSAWSLEAEEFSESRFSELQARNALVLVDIFATWCPTCARQHEILAEYQAENPEVDLHILTVDYDDDRSTVRRFRAPRQSTLLLFKGTEQQWFSVAETRPEVIFAEINRAAALGEE